MRHFLIGAIRLFFLLILILIILIVLFPSVMSKDWGHRLVVKGVNFFIPGEIEIQALQLQWTKKQTIRGLTLKDPKGEIILKIERLSIDAPLWKLLTQGLNVGFIQIKELTAMLAIDEKRQNNFQYALGMLSTQNIKPISQLSLSHVNAHLHLFANYHSFILWAKGMTQQQDLEGLFEIDLLLNGMHSSNWNNFMNDLQQYLHGEGSRRAAIQMRIVNFPTDVLDRLFSFKSFRFKRIFHSLMGNHVNIILNKGPNTEGLLNAKIQTPFLEGEISGKLANGALTLQEPAHLRLEITTQLLQAMTHPHARLHQSTQIDMTSPYLFIPLAMLNPQAMHDFCQWGFKVEIAIGKTEMSFHPLGLLNIHHLKAQLDSESGDSRLYFRSIGYVEYDKEPVHINSEQWFFKPSHFSAFVNNPLESMTVESDFTLLK